MAIPLPQLPTISEGEVSNAAVDFTDLLGEGEFFIGIPEVDETGILTGYVTETGVPILTAETDLTVTNVSVNSGPIKINKRTVAAGKALQFTVSGQQKGNTYGVTIGCFTTSLPTAQRPVRTALFKVK